MTPANPLETTVTRAAAWKDYYRVRTPFILVAALWASASVAEAQGGLTLFSLGASVPQNTHLNASYQPSLDFIGLPIISGPGFHVNNRFNFEQAFERTGKGMYRLNIDETLDRLGRKNTFLMESRVPLLSLSMNVTRPETSLSLFINERIFAGIQYQKELVETLWKGTDALRGQTVSLKETVASSTYFREYGVGIRTRAGKRLSVGIRFKVLQGFFNVRSLPGMNASVYVHPATYVYNFSFENAGINTAGISNMRSAAYLASNPNKGVAFDMGLSWNKSKRFNFSAAVNDAGFIAWKKGPQTFQVADTTFSFESVEMRSAGAVSAALDTLENNFSPVRDHQPYTANLSGRAVLSSSLLLNSTDRISLLLMNQLLVNQLQTSVSVAYSKKVSGLFAFSGALVKLPQHWPRPGCAAVFKTGAVQLFIATDNLLGFFKVSNARVLDLQLGMNLYPGARQETE